MAPQLQHFALYLHESHIHDDIMCPRRTYMMCVLIVVYVPVSDSISYSLSVND